MRQFVIGKLDFLLHQFILYTCTWMRKGDTWLDKMLGAMMGEQRMQINFVLL